MRCASASGSAKSRKESRVATISSHVKAGSRSAINLCPSATKSPSARRPLLLASERISLRSLLLSVVSVCIMMIFAKNYYRYATSLKAKLRSAPVLSVSSNLPLGATPIMVPSNGSPVATSRNEPFCPKRYKLCR